MKEILLTFGLPLIVSLLYFAIKYKPKHFKYRISATGIKKIAPKEKKMRIPLIALFLFDGLFILGMSFILAKTPIKLAVPMLQVTPGKLHPTIIEKASTEVNLQLIDRLFDLISRLLGTGATLVGILIGIKDLKNAKKA